MTNEQVGVDPKEILKIELQASHIAVIMEGLQNGPYNVVSPIIAALREQLIVHYDIKKESSAYEK